MYVVNPPPPVTYYQPPITIPSIKRIMDYTVTKESLIGGILIMFKMGELSEDIALQQIKHFATDERVDWAAN